MKCKECGVGNKEDAKYCNNCGVELKRQGSSQDFSEKLDNIGKKMQKAGCALTFVFTIPILLAIFFGIPGLIIGIVIAMIAVPAVLKQY